MSNNVFRSGVIFKVPPHFVQVIGRHFVFVSSQATLMLSLVPRPSPGPALGKLNSRFCKSPESRYKYLEIPCRVVTWYMGSGLKAQNMTGIRAHSKGLRAQKNGIRDRKAFEPESGIRFITRSKNLLSHYFSA